MFLSPSGGLTGAGSPRGHHYTSGASADVVEWHGLAVHLSPPTPPAHPSVPSSGS